MLQKSSIDDQIGMTKGYSTAERLPFPEARRIVRSWELRSRKAYYEYINKKNPAGIPYSPEIAYKNKGWKGWKDYLGTEWLPFQEAREIVRSLGFRSIAEYLEFARNYLTFRIYVVV